LYPTESDRCPACFKPLAPGAECDDPLCAIDWTDRSLNDLPRSAVLGDQFRVGRVLGRGGFGITYLGWDERLQHRRAVKECFPQGLVRRSRDGMTVLPSSEQTKRQFEIVRDLFLREARVLAHFHDQPGIVSVQSILDTNGSAYLVMEYLQGQTLKDYLEAQPDSRIEFERALGLLHPVMEALTAVHEQQWLHRDISPDNIFLTRRGMVKLLDFGAARYAAGQQTRSLPVILKEGYAPAEQYSAKGQQGTWTDVYALAATLYRAITGVTPPPALDRLEVDEIVPPSHFGIDITPAAEHALLNALAVKWQYRTATIDQFTSSFNASVDVIPEPPEPAPLPRPEPIAGPPPIHVVPPPIHVVPPPIAEPPPVWEPPPPEPEPYTDPELYPPDEDVEPPPPGPSFRWALYGALGLVIVSGIAASIYLLMPGTTGPTTATTTTVPGPLPETSMLVIDAVPWATVERLVDARGSAHALPESSTPLAIPLAAGDYRVTLSGPPPGNERRELTVTVPPNATQIAPIVTFSEIRADDYFREQAKGGPR
jgi:serine/threonine protein kinase